MLPVMMVVVGRVGRIGCVAIAAKGGFETGTSLRRSQPVSGVAGGWKVTSTRYCLSAGSERATALWSLLHSPVSHSQRKRGRNGVGVTGCIDGTASKL
jgi:hypothetical protein